MSPEVSKTLRCRALGVVSTRSGRPSQAEPWSPLGASQSIVRGWTLRKQRIRAKATSLLTLSSICPRQQPTGRDLTTCSRPYCAGIAGLVAAVQPEPEGLRTAGRRGLADPVSFSSSGLDRARRSSRCLRASAIAPSGSRTCYRSLHSGVPLDRRVEPAPDLLAPCPQRTSRSSRVFRAAQGIHCTMRRALRSARQADREYCVRSELKTRHHGRNLTLSTAGDCLFPREDSRN